jgi:hypothetical protein
MASRLSIEQQLQELRASRDQRTVLIHFARVVEKQQEVIHVLQSEEPVVNCSLRAVLKRDRGPRVDEHLHGLPFGLLALPLPALREQAVVLSRVRREAYQENERAEDH